jgi:LmbE family N-acetylglucosaminyl deacetylase
MRHVLAVGAHPDDIELGCAGTLAAHRAAGDAVTMLVLTGGQNGPGLTSERWAEAQRAAMVLDVGLIWGGLVDCTLVPDAALIATVENAIRSCTADVVYVHAPDDSHQDHRAAAAAVMSAGRMGSRILYYRSPSTVQFHPSLYVDVAEHLGTKLAALDCHRSQVDGSAMVDPEVVVVSARYFGALARIQYAEAFSPARFVWDLAPQGRQAARRSSQESVEQPPPREVPVW